MMVSVIIPAFKAHNHLSKGLDSIRRAAIWANSEGLDVAIEAIVALDDGAHAQPCYDPLVKQFEFIRLVKTSQSETWPSATRNRAMAVANGDYFAFLDSDDTWSENYLARTLPLAIENGVAFARTRVITNNATDPIIAELPSGPADNLTLYDLGHISGSFHPVVHRSLVERNIIERAQDVWNAATCLENAGGRAPLASDAFYQLHLRDGSMTTDDQYSNEISDSYLRLETRARHEGRSAAFRNVWRQKYDLNQRFINDQTALEAADRILWPSFYHWRVDQLTKSSNPPKLSVPPE